MGIGALARDPSTADKGGDYKEAHAIAETKCHMAGHCLCSEEGRVLYRLRNSILRWMKFLTPRGSPERELLADGHYVFVLRAERKQPFFDAFFDDEEGSSDVFNEDTYTFWHVSFVNFSPYTPVFQSLVCPALEAGEPLPDHEIEVKAKFGFKRHTLFRLRSQGQKFDVLTRSSSLCCFPSGPCQDMHTD